MQQLPKNTLLQGGKYKIEKVLGQGGFGITYLATQKISIEGPIGQIETEIKLAIKEFFMKDVCNREEDSNVVSIPSVGSKQMAERFKQKFIKEAWNISKLKHPHIIKVVDVFEENDTAYYVMEYHGNGSLNSCIKQNGAFSEEEATKYILQIADALDYIHKQQMNHLDIKPDNVLLNNKGEAVLIDFGLSKCYDADGEQTSSTPIGVSVGYAPLEQSRVGGVGTFSPATDIYSLGATFYKLVTGQTPPDASEVLDEGLPNMPDSISQKVQNAITQAMEARRKKRPQNIKEFLKLLNIVSIAPLQKMVEKVCATPIIITSYLNEQEVVKTNKDVSTLLVDSSIEDKINSINKSIEAIDLGLSVKWANCNVGAVKPTDCGNYYAWGETKIKTIYDTDNYLLNNIDINKEYVKYLDVVQKEYGSSWRIPTMEEMTELINVCKWEWEILNNSKGYRVIGPNGNSIFVPCCGYRIGSSIFDKGTKGAYWSATLFNNEYAYSLMFTELNIMLDWCNRVYGRNIRAVYVPNHFVK